MNELPKRIVIEITKEDIKNGRRWSIEFDPVALALNKMNLGWEWTVGGKAVFAVKRFNEQIRLEIPFINSKRLRKFIQKFDDGEKVKPGRFVICRK